MKAIVITRPGSLDVLQIQERPLPEPSTKKVRRARGWVQIYSGAAKAGSARIDDPRTMTGPCGAPSRQVSMAAGCW